MIQQNTMELENSFWDFYNELLDITDYSEETLNIVTERILDFIGLEDVEGKRSPKHILIINNHKLFNFINAKNTTVMCDIANIGKNQIKEMKDNPGVYNLNIIPIYKIVLVDDKSIHIPEEFLYNL